MLVLTAVAALMFFVPLASASVTVTAATGGTSISVDTAANGSNTYTTLGNIVLAETGSAKGDFATGTNVTLIIDAPTGWQFKTGSETGGTTCPAGLSVCFTGSKDITAASISVAASAATVTYSVGGTSNVDSMTIQGLQVQPTSGSGCSTSPCKSDNLFADSSGTGTITGITKGTVSSHSTATNLGSLSAVPGTVSKIALSGATSSTAGSFSSNITATLEDQFGNTNTRATNTVITPSSTSTGGNKKFTTTGHVTQSTFTITSGTSSVSFDYYDEKAGGWSITLANDSSLTNPSAYAFTVSAATASKYLVTSSSSTPTVGTSVTITAQLADTYGNSVSTSGNTVTWSSTNGGSFGSPTSTTDGSGVATVSFTVSTTANTTHTATATTGSSTGTTSNFTTVAGAASKYVVTSSNYSPTAGDPVTITAQLTDQYSNHLTSGGGTTVTWSKTGTGGSFGSSTSSVTNGVATVSFTTRTTSGTTYTITATDNATPTNLTGTTSNITTQAGPASEYVVTSSNYTPVAGTSVTISAQLADQYGNAVSTLGLSVTWTHTEGGSFSGSNPSITNTSGIATVTFNTSTTASDVETVTATTSAMTGTTANITTKAGTATKLVFSGASSSTAGANSSSITATLEDQYNNTATNSGSTLTITPASSSSGANKAFKTTGGTSQSTFTIANGASAVSFLYYDELTGTYGITLANDGGLTNPSALTFTVNPGALNDFLVQAYDGSALGNQTAGSSFSVKVTAQDAFGNTKFDYTGAPQFSTGESDTSATLPDGSYHFTTGAYLADYGVHIYSGLTNSALTLTKAQSGQTIHVADSSSTGDSASFTVNPGAINNFLVQDSLGSNIGTQTAGTSFSVKVTARDQYNNTKTDYAGAVHFAVGTADAGKTLPSDYTFTTGGGNDNGVHTFSSAVTLEKAQSNTIAVNDTVATSATGTSNSFTVNAATASQIALSGATSSIAGSNSNAITATLEDQFGNTATYGLDVSITPSSSSSSLSSAFKTTGGATQAQYTIASGGSAVSFKYYDETAGSYSITLSNDQLLTDPSAYGFTVIHAAADHLAVATQPAGATAGSTFSTQPVVGIYDAFGNAVNSGADATANITASIGSGCSATGDLHGTTTVAADDGFATFTNLRIDCAGSHTLHFVKADTSGGGGTGQLSVDSSSFTVNPGALNDFLVQASNGSALGDQTAGTSFSVKVTAQDAFGNTKSDYTGAPQFSVGLSDAGKTLPDGSYHFTTGGGNDNGVHTYSGLILTKAQSGQTIHVADGSTGDSATFTVNPGALDSFTVKASDGSALGDQTAGTAFSVQVTAYDAFNNVKTNYTGAPQFSTGLADAGATLPDGSYHFSGGDAGVHTYSGLILTKTQSGQTIHVHGSPPSGDSATFTVNPGALNDFLVQASDGSDLSTQTAGTSFSVKVTAQDAFGNTKTDYTGAPQFSTGLSDASATLPDGSYHFTTGGGNDNGVHTYSGLTLTKAQSGQTIHVADSSSTGDSASFTVDAAAAVQIDLSGATSSTAGQNSSTITATVEDVFGNAATFPNGVTVTMHSNSTGTNSFVFSGLGVNDNHNGSFTLLSGSTSAVDITYNDTKAGNWTLSTTNDQGLTDASGYAFTVDPGSLDHFTVTTPGGGAVGDQTAGVAFDGRVTAYDTFNNVKTDYTGAPQFSTGLADAGATLPDGSYNFTGGDAGSHVYTGLTLTKAQSGQTIHVADSSPIGDSASFTVNAATADHYSLSGADSSTAGSESGNITATLLDPYGNVATYTHDVVLTPSSTSDGANKAFHDTSSNPQTTFTIPQGSSTVDFRYYDEKAGNWTISSTNDQGLSDPADYPFTVNPATADHYTLSGADSSTAGSESGNITATLLDPYGNVATYTHDVVLTPSSNSDGANKAFHDTSSNPQTTFTIPQGSSTVDFRYYDEKAGSWTLSSTNDQGLTDPAGYAFTVDPAGLDHFDVTDTSGNPTDTQTAGTPFNVQVTARDQFGNVADFFGTVDFSSNKDCSDGCGTSDIFFGVLDSHSITLTQTGSDAAVYVQNTYGAQTGSSNPFTVDPAAATQVVFTSSTSDLASGTTRDLTAALEDQFGNVETGDNSSTVDFSQDNTSTGSVDGLTTGVPVTNGVATDTVSGHTAGNVDLRATSSGLTDATQSFNVVPGTSDHLHFTSSTAGLQSGDTRQISVQVQDVNDNVVTSSNGDTVNIVQSGVGDVSFGGNSTAAPTTTNGVATATATGQTTGSVALDASSTDLGGISDDGASNFSVYPAQYAISGDSSQTAGGQNDLTITAQDALYGGGFATATNYTGDHTLVFSGANNAPDGTQPTVNDNNGTVQNFGDPTTLTFTNGQTAVNNPGHANGGLTLYKTERASISASGDSGAIPTASPLDVTVDPAGLDHFDVTDTSGNAIDTQTAGTAFNVKVTARDQFGNLQSDFTDNVDFSSNKTCSDGCTTSDNFVGGVLDSHSVTLTKTGSDATVNVLNTHGPQNGSSTTFTVNPAAIDHFTLSLGALETNGQPFASTDLLTAYDQFGNVKTDFNAATDNVTISANSPLTGTVSGLSGGDTLNSASDFTDGVAYLAGSLTYTGNADTGTFTATSASGKSGTSGSVTIQAGTAAKLAIATQPVGGASGQQLATQPVVNIEDAQGNLVTSDSSTQVQAAISQGAGGTLGGTQTVTASNGVATFTDLTLAGKVGTHYKLTFSDVTNVPALDSATSDNVDVTTGDPAQYVVTSSDYSPVAGSTVSIYAQLADSAGNPVAQQGHIVYFTKNLTSGSFSPFNMTSTDSSGVAAVYLTVSSVAGRTYTVTAQGRQDNTFTGTSPDITTLPGGVDHFAISNVGTQRSGAGFDVTITAQDASNNTITDFDGTVDVSTNNAVCTQGCGQTAAFTAGVLTETMQLDRSGGGNTISVLEHAGIATGQSNSFLIVPNHFDVSAPSSVTSGNSFPLTVTAKDADGQTATSYAGTVHFSGGGAGALLPADYAFQGSDNGSHMFKGVKLLQAGTQDVNATDTGVADLTGTSNDVTVAPGPARQLVYTSSTASLGGGVPRTLTVQIEDAAGNVVTSPDYSVTFSQVAGTGTVSGLPDTVTSSSGVASKLVTGGLVGSVSIRASAVLGGTTKTATTNFSVVPGAPDHLVYTSGTADLTSGSQRTLSVTVKDSVGNRVYSPNVPVTFTQTSGSGTVRVLPATVTSSSGIASKAVAGVLAGPVTITAHSDGLTPDATTSFTVVPGPAAKLGFTSSTAPLASGTSRTLTAQIQDAAGNLVTSPDYSVTFTQVSGTGTVTGLPDTVTSSNGVASKDVSGVLAGGVSVQASAVLGGTPKTTTTSFKVIGGAPDHLSFTSSTADLASGSGRVLSVTVFDAAGNRTTSPNVSVTFAKTGGTGTVNGLGTVTSSNGVAQKTVAGALAGPITITAHSDGLTPDASTSFTVVPGPAAKLVFTSSTASLANGTSRTLTAQIQDAAGNAVTSPDYSVTFTRVKGPGTVSGLPDTVTSSGGTASKMVTATGTGSITITASAVFSGITRVATTSFNIT